MPIGEEIAKKILDAIISKVEDNEWNKMELEFHNQIIKKTLENGPNNIDAVYFVTAYKSIVKQAKRKKDIIDLAINYMNENADPKKVETDWYDFFFDKVKNISNEEMKIIWAKILAEEINNPKSISLSLLHSLSIMSSEQAIFFCNVSRFAFREYNTDNIHLLIFISSNRALYNDSGITPSKLRELDRLGLIECDFKDEYVFLTKEIILTKGNHKISIYNKKGKIKIGNVNFTEDGRKLFHIASDDIKGYDERILDFTLSSLEKRECTIIVNDRPF